MWTMARKSLHDTTVVLRAVSTPSLKRAVSYLGAGSPGHLAAHIDQIGRPNLDGTLLAKGMGVSGTRVSSAGCFGKKLWVEMKGEGLTPIKGAIVSLAARRRQRVLANRAGLENFSLGVVMY
jgi:hypothetical protein